MTHLAIHLFDQAAGVSLNHVPYRGGAPMLQDLLAGQVSAAFVVLSALVPHVQSGKLRALAIAGAAASPCCPMCRPWPSRIGDFRATIWFGLFAPTKTPDVVLDRIHGAVQAALQTEKVKQLWADQGVRVELESRADFARFVAEDTERWSRIARAANIKLE